MSQLRATQTLHILTVHKIKHTIAESRCCLVMSSPTGSPGSRVSSPYCFLLNGHMGWSNGSLGGGVSTWSSSLGSLENEEKPGKTGGNICWGDTGDSVHLRLLRNKGIREVQTEEEDVGVSSGEGLGRRL